MDNGKRSSHSRDLSGLLVGLKDGTGARFGAFTDQQCSVLALMDSSGNLAAEYTCAPYGALARFRSPDPTAQEANPYNYAQGDPINNPTGAYGWADFAGDAVGRLFGLAAGVSSGTAISPCVTLVGGAIGAVAAGGCTKETVSNVVADTINGHTTGLGEAAGACAGRAVLGAL